MKKEKEFKEEDKESCMSAKTKIQNISIFSIVLLLISSYMLYIKNTFWMLLLVCLSAILYIFREEFAKQIK